ncbi:MAG: glutamyl-tRNA reductase [Alphaproteobacteria bacterium]
MSLNCISFNHKNTTLEQRESLYISEEKMPTILRELSAVLSECVILSTCNRTEFYYTSRSRKSRDKAFSILSQAGFPILKIFDEEKHLFKGAKAVKHLFRVASSLESQIIGENQILAQTKRAFHVACENDTNGLVTNKCFHRAFAVGKSVRTETTLCTGKLNTGGLAVKQAQKNMPAFQNANILIIGAGEIAEAILEELLPHARVTLTSRTNKSAKKMKEKHPSIKTIPFEEMKNTLQNYTLLFTATSADKVILNKENMPNKKLTIYDLALPRDVDPSAAEKEHIIVYNIRDLDTVESIQQSERRKEIPKAEIIIAKALEDYQQWISELPAVPSIKTLQEICNTICTEEMNRIRKDVSPENLEIFEHTSHRISKKLLKVFINELKETTAKLHNTLKEKE